MPATPTADAADDVAARQHDRRWWILAVVGIAQLMVVLDSSIVNVALPSAQKDLGFSDDLRQWVVTSYALAFGSLLLLGGRLGDSFGRKRILIVGFAGFALASALAGAAQSFGMLVAARAIQGLFGALLAPSALATLATTFSDDSERGKAFGIFGALAGGGAGIGLLLGGVLTEVLSWRYSLYVNLLFAIPAALMAARLLVHESPHERPPLDLGGALTATAGLFALIFGFSSAQTDSWTGPATIAALAAAIVLLGAFAVLESRSHQPLLPAKIVLDRVRGGSYLGIGFSFIAQFAILLFLTYFLQRNKGFTPIQTGLAFLPIVLTIIATSTTVNIKLLQRVGPRLLITLGLTLSAAAMLWFAQLEPDSSYAAHILPGLIVLGLGFGNIIAPAIASATYGVAPHETGIASAMVNTSQQVAGSLGLAVLSTIVASATTSFAAGKPASPQLMGAAAVHGYTTAFYVAAGVLIVGAVVCGTIMRSVKVVPEQSAAEPTQAEPVPAG